MPTCPKPLLPRPAHRVDRRDVLRWGAAVASTLALGAAATPAPAATLDLATLMQMLAQVKAGEATFVEKRYVTMLERTLQSSGRLSFSAPDTFVRETLKPRQERLAVVGNDVTMSLGARSRTVPLDSLPEAALVVGAIRGTLTGNRELIERSYTASVSGTPQRWLLELVPRDVRLREQVVSVRVTGQQAVVNEVSVTMADGDRSVMTIEPVAAAKPVTAGAPTARPASAAR